MIDWWPIFVSAVCAGMLVPLVILVRSIGQDQPGGVQKLHRVPTSRLGGVIVVVACFAAQAVALDTSYVALSTSLPLTLAALPVVLAGLAEDLTRRRRLRETWRGALTRSDLS